MTRPPLRLLLCSLLALGLSTPAPPSADAQVSGIITVGADADVPHLATIIDRINRQGVNGPTTIRLKPGIYREQARLSTVKGASETNQIVIESSDGRPDETTIQFDHIGSAGVNEHVIRIDTTPFVTIRNLSLVNRGQIYGIGVKIVGSDDITVEGCILVGRRDSSFSALSNSALWVQQSNRVTLQKNRIDDFDMAIRGFGTTEGSRTRSLTVVDNTIKSGVLLAALWFERIDELQIARNTIHNADLMAIQAEDCKEGLQITRNRIVGRGHRVAGGISLRDCAGMPELPAIIANNEIALTGFDTVTAAIGLALTNVSHTDVLHNTVNLLGSTTDRFQSTTNTVLQLTFNVDSVRILNNIFVNLRGRQVIFGPPDSSILFDHNNYYTTGDEFVGLGTRVARSVDSLRIHYGNNNGSLSVLPCFNSRTDLTAHNPALDGTGTNRVPVFVDIDGRRRDTANPDIGARSFTGSADGMSGPYSIGIGADHDFPTLFAAIEELHGRCIEGPVELLLSPGDYEEALTINEIPGASASTPITIRSLTGDRSSVRLETLVSSNLGRGTTIRLRDADHIRLQDIGFGLDDSISLGIAVELVGRTDSIIFDNVLFDGSAADNSVQIFSENGSTPDGLVIRNSRFSDVTRAISLTPCFAATCDENLRARDIQILDNEILAGDERPTFGLPIALTFVESPQIQGNRIRGYGTGISLSGLAGSPRIEANDIVITGSAGESSAARGITISPIHARSFAPTGIIANNMIRVGNPDFPAKFSQSIGLDIGQSKNLAVIFNTIVVADTAATTEALVAGFGSDSLLILNNILGNLGGGPTFRFKFIERFNSTFTVDHNLLFASGDTLAIWNDTGRVDLDEIRATYGYEVNSIIGEPRFIDETSLHIRSDSPARGRGIGLPDFVGTDIDDERRSHPWPEIGADELLLLDVDDSEWIRRVLRLELQ